MLQPATRPLPGGPAYLCEYVELRGEPVCVLDVARRLGVEHRGARAERKLVILRVEGIAAGAVRGLGAGPGGVPASDMVTWSNRWAVPITACCARACARWCALPMGRVPSWTPACSFPEGSCASYRDWWRRASPPDRESARWRQVLPAPGIPTCSTRCTGSPADTGFTLRQSRVRRGARAQAPGGPRAELPGVDPHRAGGRLLHAVSQSILVGETYFFRHPEHFGLLMNQLVPEAIARGAKSLRAWSAGCSTGEEAYSLAACLRSATAGTVPVQVLGTDLKEASLAAARLPSTAPGACAGRAASWSPRSRAAPGRHVEVLPSVRSLCRFAPDNLRQPALPVLGSFDFIFCRNVLWYFERDHGPGGRGPPGRRTSPRWGVDPGHRGRGGRSRGAGARGARPRWASTGAPRPWRRPPPGRRPPPCRAATRCTGRQGPHALGREDPPGGARVH